MAGHEKEPELSQEEAARIAEAVSAGVADVDAAALAAEILGDE